MRKHDNSFGFHSESGFTLVEILVALVILLLVVTACFPLFTMATKITHENRARMIAAELAKRELEHILAQVTPSNYISEEDGAPLKTGISEYYFDDDGNPLLDENGSYSDTPDPDSRFALFEARKIVQWVDDPDDGLHPEDKFPFDYKALSIEVSCPSLFTGNVTKKADFKTFVAREGTASPITGLVVEVVELLDSIPSQEEVNAAAVTIINLNTGNEDFAITNNKGLAYFKVDFPESSEDVKEYNYEVSVEVSDLMMDPSPAHLNQVKVKPDITSEITIDMAKPGRISVNLMSPVGPGNLHVTTNSGYDELMPLTTAEPNTKITRSFENLWPFDAYELNAEFPIFKTNFAEERGFVESPEDGDDINIWDYSADEASWVAKPGVYGPDVSFATDHRLKYLMDLSAYSPGDASVQVNKAFINPISGFTLDADVEGTAFEAIQMNKDSAAHDADTNNHWISIINLHDLDTKIANNEPITLPTLQLKVVTSDSFALRVRSTPDINEFIIKDFYITCRYQANVTFNSSGENYVVNLTQ